MSLYIRAYEDYSYEIIFTQGKVRKKRIHLLINPGNQIKLQGTTKNSDTEVNIQSLTHILAMETSVIKPDLIKRTVKIAEMTNKPIITNKESSEKFREKGLSIKQLRLLGFQEEVIDGLYVDPIYKEEIGVTDLNKTTISPQRFYTVSEKLIDFTKSVPRRLNPLNWKPVKKVKQTITGSEVHEMIVDAKNPLALYIRFSKSIDVLIPLDTRAIEFIDDLVPETTPRLILLPNLDVSDTLKINHKTKALLIFNKEHKQEKPLIIPKTYNPDAKHDTIYVPFEEWIDIDEII